MWERSQCRNAGKFRRRHAKCTASALTFLPLRDQGSPSDHTESSRTDPCFCFKFGKPWTGQGNIKTATALAVRFSRLPHGLLSGRCCLQHQHVTRLFNTAAPFCFQLNDHGVENMEDFQKETPRQPREARGGEGGAGRMPGVRRQLPGCPGKALHAGPRTAGACRHRAAAQSPKARCPQGQALLGDPTLLASGGGLSPWGSLVCRRVTSICLHVTWPPSLCILVQISPF